MKSDWLISVACIAAAVAIGSIAGSMAVDTMVDACFWPTIDRSQCQADHMAVEAFRPADMPDQEAF